MHRTVPRISSAVAASVLIVVVSACAKSDGISVARRQRITALSGGVIEVTAADDALLAGTRIEIPPGALAQDTTITIARGGDPIVVGRAEGVSPVVRFAPAGTTFVSPVRLTLPYTPSVGQHRLRVHVREGDGAAAILKDANELEDLSSLRYSFDVRGFSEFQVARFIDCDTAAEPTCVDDPWCRWIKVGFCSDYNMRGLASDGCFPAEDCSPGLCGEGEVCDPRWGDTFCMGSPYGCSAEVCMGPYWLCMAEQTCTTDGYECVTGDPCVVGSCVEGICRWVRAPDGTSCGPDPEHLCQTGECRWVSP
jgi:hypothetical protein